MLDLTKTVVAWNRNFDVELKITKFEIEPSASTSIEKGIGLILKLTGKDASNHEITYSHRLATISNQLGDDDAWKFAMVYDLMDLAPEIGNILRDKDGNPLSISALCKKVPGCTSWNRKAGSESAQVFAVCEAANAYIKSGKTIHAHLKNAHPTTLTKDRATKQFKEVVNMEKWKFEYKFTTN